MPANFLHGIEFIEVNVGPIPIGVVKSAVVGIVGTAPSWAVQSPAVAPAINTCALVNDTVSSKNFGPKIKGYTIPYAIAAVQEQGFGLMVVVNVFNQATHKTHIASQAVVLPAVAPQVASLGHMGVASVVVKDVTNATTYVLNTDYTLDAINGTVAVKAAGALVGGATVHVTFDYADPSLVVDADIVGAGTTGMLAWLSAFGQFGFFPKLLIAPGYSQDATVAAALDSIAGKIRAMCFVDCAAGTTPATAIANRSANGNSFQTSSKRTVLCAPQEIIFDDGLDPVAVTIDANGNPVNGRVNANRADPYSQWVAGAAAASDLARGYWTSPSNQQIDGILGPDVPMYVSPIDPNADVQLMNAAGILSVFSGFGTGLRTWGNRSAAYPTATTPDQFISVRRTMDVIEESLQLAMLQFIDQPITNGLIDSIVASGNSFVRSLIQRGALEPGSKVSYNPAENPPAQVAGGQLVFDIDCIPPPPLERLTFNVFLDTNLLAGLGDTTAAQAQG